LSRVAQPIGRLGNDEKAGLGALAEEILALFTRE
jgi:hypothetical protein